MPTYTSQQRAAITQFVNFTQAKESIAARTLKTHDWNVERAVNAHYSGSASSGPSQSQRSIKKIFDENRDDATNEPDKIGIEGCQIYFQKLNISLDHVVSFALLDLLEAPAMGELTREGFTNGWQNASTHANPCDTIERQGQYAQSLQDKLTNDPAYFRQVYKATFKFAKPENQRAVPVEIAFAFWDMFFRTGSGGIVWNTNSTKWMDLWDEYYKEKNKRPVNKDLWNQFAELVKKTRETGGETLDWWSEDGAWPTAVDDFVAFVRQKRSEEGMDTS